MARVGDVPTVSAYQGNAGQQLMKLGDKLEGVSKEYENKQQRELAEAKKLYAQGLNINLYNSINELRNDPKLSSNPQGLASAMDDVLNKTLADVDDDDVKMEVMVDYQLKKGTYINHAQAEFNRIQRERTRSYAFDSVYANIDSMGASFANAVAGNSTEDDIANFQHSLDAIQRNINATNPDGTYIFTDRQRRAMMRDAQSSYLNGFKAIYEQLDDEQRSKVSKAIDDDSFHIMEIRNKEKPEEVSTVSLRDIVGDDSYKDIKNYTKKYNQELLNQKLKEEKYQANLASYEFLQHPTEEGLQKVFELNPNMSKETRERYETTLANDPVYKEDQKTYYADMYTAQTEINNFINQDFEDDDRRFYQLAGVIEKINKSANKGKLEKEDVDGLKKLLLTASMDKQVADNLKQFDAYNKIYWDQMLKFPILGNVTSIYKQIKTKKELEDMALPLQRQVIEGLSSGASPEEMKDLLKKSKRKFINFKYPEVEDKNVGDTLNVRGITYKIISLDPIPTLEPVE